MDGRYISSGWPHKALSPSVCVVTIKWSCDFDISVLIELLQFLNLHSNAPLEKELIKHTSAVLEKLLLRDHMTLMILYIFIYRRTTFTKFRNGLDYTIPPPTTIHHQPVLPTTSLNISTATYHYPPPAKIYPPQPTTTQKMNHHPAKAKLYPCITSFWFLILLKYDSPLRNGYLCDKSFNQYVFQIQNFC